MLDLSRLGRIDYTGALALSGLVEDAEAAGLDVSITNVATQNRRIIDAVFRPTGRSAHEDVSEPT